jgi:type IV pilus assembly protein PilW
MTQTSFDRRFGRPSSRMESPQGGFSLVEIMVALVIGMIGVLVIMQVARTAETQRRITVGASGSQDSGALGIYSIQRDVRQAGYGLNSASDPSNVFGCPLTLPADNSRTPALPERTLDFLAPVIINSADIPEGDANTDTLLVVYGSSASSAQGDLVYGIQSLGNKSAISIMSPKNFKEEEYVILAPQVPQNECATKIGVIEKVDAASEGGGEGGGGGGEGGGSSSSSGSGSGSSSGSGGSSGGEGGGGEGGGGEGGGGVVEEEERDPSTVFVVPDIGEDVSLSQISVLFNLGSRPRVVAYAVRNGNLTTCDYMENDCSELANWQNIAYGIVSLRAQYGRDAAAPRNGSIDTWDQATPTKTGSQDDFARDWARIAAVRLALVARNGEVAGSECAAAIAADEGIEDKCPTRTAPVWAGSVVVADDIPKNPNAVGIDLTRNPDGAENPDWQQYRYQVFETVVPLRNIPWMGAL